MAFCEMHFRSAALGKQVAANILLPEGKGSGPFPVLYLLHGLSDDHTMWMRRSSLERHVGDLPLIVVMPNGDRSFYCDTAEGDGYETFMTRDLIGFVDETFHTVPTREGRVLGGLSMGGYGAIKLALKFPQLYCSTVSHSGALQCGHLDLSGDDDWQKGLRRIYGPHPQGGPNDLYALAHRINRAALPAIRIDCGVDDFLIEHNRAFHSHLETLGIPHEYAEFEGAHSWQYWDLHIQDALSFHRKQLGI